jgi:hypothetical protein
LFVLVSSGRCLVPEKLDYSIWNPVRNPLQKFHLDFNFKSIWIPCLYPLSSGYWFWILLEFYPHLIGYMHYYTTWSIIYHILDTKKTSIEDPSYFELRINLFVCMCTPNFLLVGADRIPFTLWWTDKEFREYKHNADKKRKLPKQDSQMHQGCMDAGKYYRLSLPTMLLLRLHDTVNQGLKLLTLSI